MEMQPKDFGLENAHADNYLGSPDVVAKIVQGYVDKVYENTKGRGDGTVSEEKFKADWMKWAKEFSDIFLGRNPNYIPVRGWNSPYSLGITIKQIFGDDWDKKFKKEYDNDPGQAFFGLLAARVVDGALKSLKNPDEAGRKFAEQKEWIIKILLGLGKRK